jgi:hypothetical protein
MIYTHAPQPGPGGGPQPGRSDVPVVIRPRCVCATVCQVMLLGRAAYLGRVCRGISERRGRKQRAKALNSPEHDAGIGCRRAQRLRCYADQPILSSNSSSVARWK